MGVVQVISTCVLDEWLVIWEDGHVVDHAPAGIVDGVDVVDIIQRLLLGDDGDAIDEVVVSADGTAKRVRALAIGGPADEPPFGIQLWLGETHQHPPAPRAVAAGAWDTREQHIMITPDLYAMSNTDTIRFGAARDPATFTRKVFDVSNEAEIIEACIAPPNERRKLAGHIYVLHDDGHLMHWQHAMCAVPDDRFTLRGLCHDISDYAPPALPYSPQFMHEDSAVGLITYSATTGVAGLSYWISSGPRWPGGHQPGALSFRHDSIHPDDQSQLRAASIAVQASLPGAPATTTVRICDTEDQWIPVSIDLSRYPTATPAGDRMHIAHMTPVQTAGTNERLRTESA